MARHSHREPQRSFVEHSQFECHCRPRSGEGSHRWRGRAAPAVSTRSAAFSCWRVFDQVNEEGERAADRRRPRSAVPCARRPARRPSTAEAVQAAGGKLDQAAPVAGPDELAGHDGIISGTPKSLRWSGRIT
jgi:hypothetical protein